MTSYGFGNPGPVLEQAHKYGGVKLFNGIPTSIQGFFLRNSMETRGSQEPVIAHLVFNLTSKVDRKWGCYT
jgi:hypothetical protein